VKAQLAADNSIKVKLWWDEASDHYDTGPNFSSIHVLSRNNPEKAPSQEEIKEICTKLKIEVNADKKTLRPGELTQEHSHAAQHMNRANTKAQL